MANRKKRRPPPKPEPQGAARAVSVAPASPGGPNRQARKDEARRQREALQRKMRRRRSMRVMGAVLAVLVVAAAISLYFVVFRQTPAEAAGCSSVLTIKPYQPLRDDRTHIGAQGSDVPTPPPISTYRSIPPTSGPHLPPGEQLPQGVYDSPPNPWSAIHSLEHGAAIIWYAPSVSTTTQIEQIKSFYGKSANNDHVIVAPYDYPSQGAAGKLKAGEPVAMVFWHHMQTCQKASFAVAQSFVDHYRVPSSGIPPLGYPADGAPEPGSPINGTPPPFRR